MANHHKKAGSPGRCKLTPDDIRAIRVMLSHGDTRPEIAERFGVSASTIASIATGMTWTHVR